MAVFQAMFTRFSVMGGFLALLLFSTGCGLFQSTTKPEPGKAPKATKPDTTKKPSEEAVRAEQKRLDSLAKARERKDSLDQLYPVRKPDTFRIALILPLFTDIRTDTFSLSKRNKAIANVASSFYLGSKLALDSLRNCGMHIKLKVFDSRNDSMRMLTIREKLKADSVDLILGPLFTENVRVLNRYSDRTKTNLVSPLTSVPMLLKNNPYYIAMDPGKAVIAKQVADLINQRFSGANVFVVRKFAERERLITQKVSQFIDTGKVASYQTLALKSNQWNTSEIFKDTLRDKRNVVFIPSSDEAFVTSAISGIKGVDTIMYIDSIYNGGQDTAKTFHDIQEEVTVIGLQEWLEYGSLDGSVMEQFRMHIMSDYHVDYQHLPTAAMVRQYRRKCYTEPDKYAIKGYDFTLLLGKLLASYGTYFQRYWHKQTFKGLHTAFHFDHKRGERGWQNYFLQKLLFQDFELKPFDAKHR